MMDLVVLFLIVYTLNVMPAFAPPTWMVLSLVGLNSQKVSVPVLALVGASAATLGRLTLAKLSRVIIRSRFLSEGTRRNIDVIKEQLGHRRAATVGSFFLYALGPFPSNYLFIAYGLTSLDLSLISIPFFLGRLVSYNFLVFSAAAARKHLQLDEGEAQCISVRTSPSHRFCCSASSTCLRRSIGVYCSPRGNSAGSARIRGRDDSARYGLCT
jgi:hypothetical protein